MFSFIFVIILLIVMKTNAGSMEKRLRVFNHSEDIMDVLGIKEYDQGEHVKKPLFWGGGDFYHELKALRRLSLYPGAWFGFPEPNNDESVFLKMNDEQLRIFRQCEECRFEKLALNLVEYGNLWWILNSDHLSILYRYRKCVKGEDPFYNCPNPCNRVPCKYIDNAIPMSCKPFYNKNMKIPLVRLTEFTEIFKYEYTCTCKYGFIWQNENCVPDPQACRDNNRRCGYGVCRQTEKGEIKCICPKAYDGESCEKLRDPCVADAALSINPNDMLCGLHKCVREPTNFEYGYRCLCKKGFISLRDLNNGSDPRCIDIDECEFMSPCKHNGTCVNTFGSYHCLCTDYFYGFHCEYQKYTTWGKWQPWGQCSATCGVGKQYSFRECPVSKENDTIECRGKNYRTQDCAHSDYCKEESIHNDNAINEFCKVDGSCYRSLENSVDKRYKPFFLLLLSFSQLYFSSIS